MSGQPMMHLAFFEALTDEPDGTSSTWRETSAGLVALRLFDGWLRAVRQGEPLPEPARVSAARAEVARVTETSTVRPVLLALLDTIRGGARDVGSAREQLLAYAKRLQLDARWRLAADVYRTFIEARPAGDVSAEVQVAALQCGYCYRMAGELAEATAAYEVGEAIATAARDVGGMLRARVCKVKLVMHRGNLPEAETSLDAIIAEAEAAGSASALSFALTDRMAVAGQRGQYEAAATFGYRALRCCDDDLERERILGDIATALGDGGHRVAAMDVHLVLAATARDTRVRLLATLNLLEAAVEGGDELRFERYRRALAEAPLPVEVRAKYHYVVGEGHRTFGQPALARAAYQAALAVAEQHQVNEIVVKAEAALRRLAAQRPATAPAAPAAGEVTIHDVIHAMHELRMSAGV